MESIRQYTDMFSCNENEYDQYSYLALSDCGSSLSPQSLLSPNSSSISMSPPAQQVPQEEILLEGLIDTNMFYNKIENFKKPTLKIVEQPTKKFRFRYKSEMSGTHGCLSGRSRKKSFPTVQLTNYSEEAIVTCSLVQNNAQHGLHPHSLVIWKGDKEVSDPHEVLVGRHNKFIAKYPNMAILFTGKKSIAGELLKHKKQLSGPLSPEEENHLRIICENEARSINLNSVCLKFAAYDENRKLICEPIFSEAIDNSKSAETCQLKIVNISKTSGFCNGGEKIFLFVEKVNKKNIKVRFFEIIDDKRVWEDFAYFTELDVHHQYGIVLKTPPYRDQNLNQDVNVFIELFRPKDNATSEEIEFRYKPLPRQNKKRRLLDNSESFLSSEGIISYSSNYDIPHNDVPLSVCNINNNNGFENINFQNKEAENYNQNQNQFSFLNNDLAQNNTSYEQNKAIPDAMYIQNFLSEFTQSHSSDYTENSSIAFIDPEFLLGNVVRDAPVKQDNIIDIIKSFGISENNLVKFFQNINESKKSQICESTKILIEKCQSTYQKDDVKDLIMINILYQLNDENSENILINLSLTQLITQELSNDENILHMLLSIDEKTLFTALLKFMYEHKLFTCINSVNKQRETALHIATSSRQPDLVTLLLSSGCDPNLCDENGNTPVHLSIINKDSKCLSNLLAYDKIRNTSLSKLDLNIRNNDGYCPIHLAFINTSLNDILPLINAGAKTELIISTDGKTILHLAVEKGDMSTTSFIVENTSVPINATTFSGFTPLHSVCVSKNENAENICRYLLENGADPLIKFNKSSCTSLAINNENFEIAKIITKHIDKNCPPQTEGSCNDEFLDEKTMMTVSMLLDKSGKWKDVAENLGFQSIISICESDSCTSSPSAIILNNIEMEQNISAHDLYNMLVNLRINDAADEIKNYLSIS